MRAVVLADAVVVRASLRVAFVREHLRRRTIAEVEIAREPDRLDRMRRRRPEGVVPLDGGHGRGEPAAIVRLRANAEDHFGQKRRLRSRQEVRTVRVQDHPVVRDLVEEVVDHVARERQLAVPQQPELDEVAVPAVHLVEAAAGDDVRVGEVEEPGFGDRLRAIGQRADVEPREVRGGQRRRELPFDRGAIFVAGDVERPARVRVAVHFRIRRGARQIADRAGQHRPGTFDVAADRLDARRGGKRGLLDTLSRRAEQCQRDGDRRKLT